MENKMQDSKREFFHKWDNTTDFEQGHTFNSYKDANKVWEYIASEISKAKLEQSIEGWKGLLENLERLGECNMFNVSLDIKEREETARLRIKQLESELDKLTTK